MPRPTIEPITRATLPDFAAFLERHMPVRRSAAQWIEGLSTQWSATRPNYGFLLREEGAVVGGIGAFYAERTIRGQPERFCNITSWCVLDSHRKYSMQLAMALVGQPGYHFTDFSPTEVVAKSLQFLKFRALDADVVVIPNLPGLPDLTSRARIISAPEQIGRDVPDAMADVWRDHARFPWLGQLIVGAAGDWCHVIYKRARFKRLPCAKIVHVSDSRLFQRWLGRVSGYFLWRGMVSTHIEKRMLDHLPPLARVRTGFNPKQYLSPTLGPGDIDYLYSESVALDL
jgi:hypothetical protein